jgi:hypothetical protein
LIVQFIGLLGIHWNERSLMRRLSMAVLSTE